MRARCESPVVRGVALVAVLLFACGPAPDDGSAAAADQVLGVESASSLPAATGAPRGMMRFRGGGQLAATPVCNSPHLSYFGGPILQSPTIVAVFWTSSVNSTLQSSIGQFYADVTLSSYWSWLHEYDTVGLAGGTDQAILPGSFGGAFVITPQVCAPGGSGCKLTDVQIQAELARQIGLGVLPAPTVDCTGNANTVYMVDFPPNISLTGPDGTQKSCVTNGFCAYHNTGTYGAGQTPLVYAALMDTFTGPCASGCGSNATGLQDATYCASHELVEAVTDPDIGLDTQATYVAPAGWADNSNGCGEIADICGDGTAGDTISVGGRTWIVQEEWSNRQGKCTSTGAASPICAGTTVTNCRKCSCGDTGQACSGGTSVCETASANVLFGACEACTATGGGCTGSATCRQSATPSQDDQCACSSATTCPAGYACGTVPDACGGTVACGTCGGGQTCNGSHQCVTAVVDAGVDGAGGEAGVAGSDAGHGSDGGGTDAGREAGGRVEAGVGGEAGTSAEAGGAADSGSAPGSGAGDGAASAADDGAVSPQAGDDAGAQAADFAPGTHSSAGCGCRALPSNDPGSPLWLPAFGAVALLGALRVRRCRRAPGAARRTRRGPAPLRPDRRRERRERPLE